MRLACFGAVLLFTTRCLHLLRTTSCLLLTRVLTTHDLLLTTYYVLRTFGSRCRSACFGAVFVFALRSVSSFVKSLSSSVPREPCRGEEEVAGR